MLLKGIHLSICLCSNNRILTAMASSQKMIRSHLKDFHRKIRGAREMLRALVSTEHPLLAHIIPIRRCNLACKYCNEYDDFSKPVQTEMMFRRVGKLSEFRHSVIAISG